MGKRVLENSGYSVLLAENGREAVEIFQHHSSEIVTVLLDLAMPVMGGNEAFRLIREIRPEVPVILMTGFDQDSAREDLGASVRAGFIQKPYSVATLVAIVRASIEEQARDASDVTE
jgi:CheY-like chemotaxis protein